MAAEAVFNEMLAFLIETLEAEYPDSAQALTAYRLTLVALARFRFTAHLPMQKFLEAMGGKRQQDQLRARDPQVFADLEGMLQGVPLRAMYERMQEPRRNGLWLYLVVLNTISCLTSLVPPVLRKQLDPVLESIMNLGKKEQQQASAAASAAQQEMRAQTVQALEHIDLHSSSIMRGLVGAEGAAAAARA